MGALVLFVRRNPLFTAYAVAMLALLTYGGVMAYRLHHAQQQLHDAALVNANDSARHDTTRVVARDSTGVVIARLLLQEHQRSDDLDKALNQLRTMTADLRVQVATLAAHQGSSADVARGPGDTLRAHFDVRQVPYTASADVALPPVGRGALDLRVAIDAATLAVHVGCSTAVRPGGVRDAQLTVHSDAWLTVSATRVTQDPQVCSYVAPAGERAWWRPTVSVGAGAVYRNGQVLAGPGVFAGWRVF